MRVADPQFSVYAYRVDPEMLQHAPLPQQSGENFSARLRALAGALSFSPIWSEMPRASIIVRQGPEPLLGMVGYFGAADKARLEALQWQLEYILPRLLYVDYARAEEDCEVLATRLVERFGRREVENFQFTAMPRGGFIVLGMLAYILGLRRSQLEPPHHTHAPLVVVDDCALSGLRFGQFLERLEASQVIFAHLYSPPELREAIEVREQGRVTSLGAHNLRDYALESMGEHYTEWHQRWTERIDRRGYWIGQPEQVCFAWNEPDFGFWNPVTEKEENGWRFVPPDLCLKNRPAFGQKPVPVQRQPQGEGPLRSSAYVLFGEFEGQVAVGNLRTKESFVLDGVAADMWWAIVEHGNLQDALETLRVTYDVDDAILSADLQEFAENLLSQGLLEEDK